jgi:NAD(P)-dependent dehydrogenase (short-subunit alcohol dehydrogenase family)
MFAGSSQIGGSLGRARTKSNRKAKMARLAGRKIIITGGASGIGRATARLFRQEGAAVAILDRSDNAAKAVADEIGAVAIACDVADPASVSAAVNSAAEAMGGLDGVINAAGILAETGIADTTAEVFSRTLAVNLTGTFLMIQAAAPLIQKGAGKGTIVNIASGVGLMPTGPGSVAYVASKGGVVALTKSVAMELAPNIRVNSVCPGAVETAMTAGYIRTPAGDPNPAITARYAMGRHAQPEELAAAILFLTSDESSFMTGIALPVDGGRTFH